MCIRIWKNARSNPLRTSCLEDSLFFLLNVMVTQLCSVCVTLESRSSSISLKRGSFRIASHRSATSRLRKRWAFDFQFQNRSPWMCLRYLPEQGCPEGGNSQSRDPKRESDNILLDISVSPISANKEIYLSGYVIWFSFHPSRINGFASSTLPNLTRLKACVDKIRPVHKLNSH